MNIRLMDMRYSVLNADKKEENLFLVVTTRCGRNTRSWNLFQVIVYAKNPLENHLCNNSATKSCDPIAPCLSSARCLSVSWIAFPPYSSNVDNISVGVIPKILSKLLDRCCRSCWKLNLTEQTTRNIGDLVVDGSTFDIVFPYFWENGKTRHEDCGMWFVPLIKTPSVDFITKKPSTSGIPKKLIDAVWNAWPVLIVALLLSLVAGIFLWALESRSNHEEFTRSFSKGSWEGFWWAFVSMTTVGYGDRCPRTILGRGFAVCWILIGICICSIFTATLTTSLTTISLEDKKTLSKANVGALRYSLEAIVGVKHQAKVHSYNTTKELWIALQKDHVHGILLDSYFSSTSKEHERIKSNNLKIAETVKSDGWSYGLFVKNKNLSDCMTKHFHERIINSIPKFIADEIKSKEASENEAAKRSASVFDPTADLFYPSIYSFIAFALVMVVAGLIWEFVITPKLHENKTNAVIPVNDSTLDKMENEMVSEVHRLFASWKVKLAEMGRVGPMDGVELEQRA